MTKLLAVVNKSIQRVLVLALQIIVTALVLVVLWGVFTRFLLGDPSAWTEETAVQLMIWLTMIGAAVADARREHLGVDYVVSKLDPTARLPVLVVAEVCVVMFAAAAMAYGGSRLMSQTLEGGQLLPALGIRKGWIYAAVPIAGITIVLSGIERIGLLVSGESTPLDHSPQESVSPD